MSVDNKRALVLGASGDQGLPQVMCLAGEGWQVRAAARDGVQLRRTLASRHGASVDRAVLARIECVSLDYLELDSLVAAFAGVDVVLANYPSSSFHDGDMLQATAEATGAMAATSGATLIVFNSSLPLPQNSLGFRAQDIRFAQRDALRASGVPTISLQPAVYMDNLLRGWAFPAIADRHCFEYPHDPALEIAWLCQRDLARLMVTAALRADLAGRDFNVGGPEILRGPEVAQILSEVSGRAIRFVSQPVDEFCADMRRVFERTATLNADVLCEELGRIYRWYNESPARPFRIDMGPVLRELPLRLTTMREWAEQQVWSR